MTTPDARRFLEERAGKIIPAELQPYYQDLNDSLISLVEDYYDVGLPLDSSDFAILLSRNFEGYNFQTEGKIGNVYYFRDSLQLTGMGGQHERYFVFKTNSRSSFYMVRISIDPKELSTIKIGYAYVTDEDQKDPSMRKIVASAYRAPKSEPGLSQTTQENNPIAEARTPIEVLTNKFNTEVANFLKFIEAVALEYEQGDGAIDLQEFSRQLQNSILKVYDYRKVRVDAFSSTGKEFLSHPAVVFNNSQHPAYAWVVYLDIKEDGLFKLRVVWEENKESASDGLSSFATGLLGSKLSELK